MGGGGSRDVTPQTLGPSAEPAASALWLCVRPQAPAGLHVACAAFLVPIPSAAPFPARVGTPKRGWLRAALSCRLYQDLANRWWGERLT